MVFVFGLVLIDVTILTIHTILEGAIANFRAGTVVNKEKPMALEGVSLTFFWYMHNYISCGNHKLTCYTFSKLGLGNPN